MTSFAMYISLIYEFQINGLIYYVLCYIKLHLLSKMVLRFIHVVECILFMNNQLNEYTGVHFNTLLLKVSRAVAALSEHE